MRYSPKPWLAGLLLCGSDNQRWKTALFLSTTLMDRRLAVYSDSLIPRGLVGRLEKVLGCRALVVMHDQEGHPSLLTTHRGDQHLTMGLKALLTSYEQAAGLSRVERVVVDREGMAAEFLATLANEGRTVVTVLRTDQYAGLESFREVGEFVPLRVNRQGKVIREVALARFGLPLRCRILDRTWRCG